MNPVVVALILVVTAATALALRGRQTPVPVQVVTLGLVCLLGYGVFSYQREQNQANERTAIERDFDRQHDTWVRETEQYESCLADADDRVQRVDDARAYEMGRIADLTASIKALAPSVSAAKFADDLETRSLESLDRLRPPLDLKAERAKCTPPGPEPTLGG